jgi:hypothetical protein
MIPTYKQLTPFLNLKTVQTDKFKTERFSVCLIIPPEERLMPVSRFVFHVLKRGCKKYDWKNFILQEIIQKVMLGVMVDLL